MAETMTGAKRKRNTPGQYPCCFSEPFLRDDIDPRIAKQWPKAPFGNLRRIWREQHCKTLNPYGSETCPYTKTDCAVAFYQAVDISLRSGKKPVAYFWKVALSSALERADHKPSAREAKAPQRSRQPGAISGRYGTRQDFVVPFTVESSLYRAITRPSPIGKVLGSFDFRSRERPSDDGEESTE